MATPTGAERKRMAVGAKKASIWGTAVALGAGYGVVCKNVTGFARKQELLRAEDVDSVIPAQAQLDVVQPAEAGIVTDFLYDPGALGTLIALLFGTAGAPAQQGATTAYKHTFQWADSIDGKFATLAREIPGKIEEIQSWKPIGWTLKSSDGGIIESTLEGVGNNVVHDSTVNQAAQMDALSYDDRTVRVLFREQSVKINDESGGDVASETALAELNGVELSFKRQGPEYHHESGTYQISEPSFSDFDLLGVKLNFAKYNAVNDAFWAKAIAETTQKMLIKFTSAQLAGVGYPCSLALYFPRLRLKVPEVNWDKIVKNGMELVAEQASAAPTGMTYTRPYAEWINKKTTDYLA